MKFLKLNVIAMCLSLAAVPTLLFASPAGANPWGTPSVPPYEYILRAIDTSNGTWQWITAPDTSIATAYGPVTGAVEDGWYGVDVVRAGLYNSSNDSFYPYTGWTQSNGYPEVGGLEASPCYDATTGGYWDFAGALYSYAYGGFWFGIDSRNGWAQVAVWSPFNKANSPYGECTQAGQIPYYNTWGPTEGVVESGPTP